MNEFYVLCSNPECSFSSRDKGYHMNGCPQCGSDLLKACPHCNTALLFKNETFCHECQERIKPEPAPKPEKKAPQK